MRNETSLYHAAKEQYIIYKNLVNQEYNNILHREGEFYALRARRKLEEIFGLSYLREEYKRLLQQKCRHRIKQRKTSQNNICHKSYPLA